MKIYYLSSYAQYNGEYEVHSYDCYFLPAQENRKLLGFFQNWKDALNAAKKYQPKVDGCRFCIPECHQQKAVSINSEYE